MADYNNDHTDTNRENKKNNWWPLLVLPILFFAGWAARDALGNDTNEAQYGVGGAPYAPCNVNTE